MPEKHQEEEYIKVYQPHNNTVTPDPLEPDLTRLHTGIFLLHHPPTKSGTLYHVTGDVLSAKGMRYEERVEPLGIPGKNFCVRLDLLGVVKRGEVERVEEVLRGLPRPTRQQGINFWSDTREIMWCREDGEPYGEGEERRGVFKCNEWTDMAVERLKGEGLLIDAEDGEGQRGERGVAIGVDS